jgi:hypothetical protein
MEMWLVADEDGDGVGCDVERTVRADLRGLGELTGVRPTLAATAITLARQLDAGGGMATAAIARELRETLRALTEASEDDDAATRLAAELSTPVGDAEGPE